MQLRTYQSQAISNIRTTFAHGLNRIVLCAPTGSGKTIIFSEITRLTHANNKTVLIITNRKELCGQTGNKLNDFGIMPDFLTANTKEVPTGAVVVSMVETLNQRLKKSDYEGFISRFDLIIIDEIHINCFNKIFDHISEKQRVIGASATPYRVDPMPPLSKYYDSIINVCQVNELIELKFLASPVAYGIPVNLKGIKMKGNDYDDRDLEKFYDDNIKYTGAILNYERYAKGKKTIVFCSGIKNSKTLSEMFCSSGYNAKHFDCYMSDKERKDILSWYFETENAILCNVGILTTGFDCPEIECIILYRATKSLPLFLQMVGRGSRVTETKKTFTILDFGNNYRQHGHWEMDRVWTLDNPKKKKRDKKEVAPVKNCPSCEAIISANCNVCPICGYEYREDEKRKKYKEIEVLLQKLTPSEIQRYAADCSVEELELIREQRNYKIGWVLHKFTTYQQFEDYEKLKGYKRGWAQYQWRNRR